MVSEILAAAMLPTAELKEMEAGAPQLAEAVSPLAAVQALGVALSYPRVSVDAAWVKKYRCHYR